MSMPRKTPPRGRAFWPILGFLLALSSAAFAFILTDPVVSALQKSLRNFPRGATVNIIIGVILFVVIGLIFSLIVAFAVPRKKSGVTEIQMTKDRKAMVNQKMARKIKQREINRQGKAR